MVGGVPVGRPPPRLGVGGLVAVVPLGERQGDPGDVVQIADPRPQPQRRADGGLRALHRVVLLGVHVQHPEPLDRRQQHVLVIRPGHAGQEPVVALVRGQLAAQAGPGQQGRGHRGLGDHAVHTGLARRHLATAAGIQGRAVHGRDGQRMRELLGVEVEQHRQRRRDGHPEVAAAAPAVRGDVRVAAGDLQSDVDLVAERDRGRQLGAGAVLGLGNGQRGRDHQRRVARIRPRVAVHVVEVAQRGAVRQGRVGGGGPARVAGQRRRPAGADSRVHGPDGRRGRAADHVAEPVQQPAPGLVQDLGWQVAGLDRLHDAGHPLQDGRHAQPTRSGNSRSSRPKPSRGVVVPKWLRISQTTAGVLAMTGTLRSSSSSSMTSMARSRPPAR